MERDDRPRAREKHVTQNSKGVHRRGEGLGSGPVGSGSHGPSPGGPGGAGQRTGGSRAAKGAAGLGLPAVILVLLLTHFLGGGGGSPALDLANLGGSGIASS